MTVDDPRGLDRRGAVAALARARRHAYRPEPYAGQESFVSSHEVAALARAAGIGPGTRVLDLCCGVGGPGRIVVRATGCRLVGVDRGPDALGLARAAAAPGARFVAAEVPALPFAARFDVVLLIETVLAFRDKAPLVAEVARLLAPGGRFALTVEEGPALAPAERAAMPGGGMVWPIELPALVRLLRASGLKPRSVADHTAAHALRARRLAQAFEADREAIASSLGEPALEALVTSHRLWAEWLARRRIRKLALVAERSKGRRRSDAAPML